MANTYTAITKKVGKWWIGWIEEMPGVNCQERTRDKLLQSLQVTLKEMIAFNRSARTWGFALCGDSDEGMHGGSPGRGF